MRHLLVFVVKAKLEDIAAYTTPTFQDTTTCNLDLKLCSAAFAPTRLLAKCGSALKSQTRYSNECRVGCAHAGPGSQSPILAGCTPNTRGADGDCAMESLSGISELQSC